MLNYPYLPTARGAQVKYETDSEIHPNAGV